MEALLKTKFKSTVFNLGSKINQFRLNEEKDVLRSQGSQRSVRSQGTKDLNIRKDPKDHIDLNILNYVKDHKDLKDCKDWHEDLRYHKRLKDQKDLRDHEDLKIHSNLMD